MVGGGGMSLICMAVYDTDENGRYEYTERTLENLFCTVDWSKHRMVMIDNGSSSVTKKLLHGYELKGVRDIITNGMNVGTARAINQGIKMRRQGEYCVKVDNDIEIETKGWIDEMEAAIERSPEIGILGLKRKDIQFDANNSDPSYRSELVQLPHEPGQTWITVEKGPSIMGTCTMFNCRLLDKIGGFQDCSIYGFDDSLISLRSVLSGFWNAYLFHINIDHIDNGGHPYTQEKHKIASEAWDKYNYMHAGYVNGSLPLYVEI